MSFIARLGALTEELVTLLTGSSAESDPEKFGVYRESALRSLRHHSYLRTNQFDVESQLAGFDERFRVHDREALADALRERLDNLSTHSTKWTPEILHFLLELSDRPTQQSRLSDLDALLQPEEDDAGPKLSWEDIAREDGWDGDRAIWRTINYADSSDEDEHNDAGSSASSGTNNTTISGIEARYRRTARDISSKAEPSSRLQQIKASQAWRASIQPKDPDGKLVKIQISEYQVLREVLFMLSGLPTTLIGPDCTPRLGYQLPDVSWDAYKALVTTFTECGRRLLPLRTFAKSEQQVALLRAFQDSICRCLRSFDKKLAEIQARYVSGNPDVVVSLIGVLEELKTPAAPLYALADIVQELKNDLHAHDFRYLELLFDVATAAQLGGNEPTYRLLGTVFFECFQFYLRPTRAWMEEGNLTPGDEIFFVSEAETVVPLSSMWHGQFEFRQTRDGVLHAPGFLQPAAKRIFATGKSVVVLKHLGRHEAERVHWTTVEPPLEFDAIIFSRDRDLVPFPELFKHGFDSWIKSKHHTASATLRRLLFESYGLTAALTGLQHVYFMTNGSVSGAFGSAIFNHLDKLDPIWKDRFTLTELAQEAFSHIVDTHRLSVTVEADGLLQSTMAARTSVRNGLPAIRLNYRLPWPVQLIVQQESLAGYQTVFTFLLQMQRAIRCIDRYRPLLDIGVEWSDERRLYYSLRSRLLWFTATLRGYITSLVLAPNVAQLHEGLGGAVDVDDMIEVHSTFMKRVINEACLDLKLGPIRECILDVLDLAIKLEGARAADAARDEEERLEASRVSLMARPGGLDAKERTPDKRAMYSDHSDDEEDEAGIGGGRSGELVLGSREPYIAVLKGLRSDFERHLRFICGGLKGVARATLDPASGKWDILAEMLETGILEHR